MMKTGLRRLLALALGAGLLTANTYAAATTFTDVPTTYWGYYYIDRAATEGLVSGIRGTTSMDRSRPCPTPSSSP